MLGCFSGSLAQVRLRLNGDDLGHRCRVVSEVETVAGAHLDDPSREPGETLVTVLSATLGFGGLADPGVDTGKDRMVDLGGHACQSRSSESLDVRLDDAWTTSGRRVTKELSDVE